MAIFGKNGAWAAALYLATMWGVYGMKNAGFKNDKELQAISQLIGRKNVGEAVKGKSATRKDAVKQLREARYAAMKGERYKELLEDPAFKKEYEGKEWAR